MWQYVINILVGEMVIGDRRAAAVNDTAGINDKGNDANFSAAALINTTDVDSLVGEGVFIESAKQDTAIRLCLMRNFNVKNAAVILNGAAGLVDFDKIVSDVVKQSNHSLELFPP